MLLFHIFIIIVSRARAALVESKCKSHETIWSVVNTHHKSGTTEPIHRFKLKKTTRPSIRHFNQEASK